jgi:hypothetical protein
MQGVAEISLRSKNEETETLVGYKTPHPTVRMNNKGPKQQSE